MYFFDPGSPSNSPSITSRMPRMSRDSGNSWIEMVVAQLALRPLKIQWKFPLPYGLVGASGPLETRLTRIPIKTPRSFLFRGDPVNHGGSPLVPLSWEVAKMVPPGCRNWTFVRRRSWPSSVWHLEL